MFASIRRHQKWLLGVIVTLTIVSFVILMDPSYSGRRGGGGPRGGKDVVGEINDRKITTEELTEAITEAQLQFLFYTGRWPGRDETSRQMFDLDRQVQERLFLLEKLRDLRVELNDEAAADWITAAFRDRETGKFNAEAYRRLVQVDLRQAGVTEEKFRKFAQHQAGIQHVMTLAGLNGGLVTPREAETLCRHENEQVNTRVALFSASNYLASVVVAPDNLMSFYTNTMTRYRVPERVQVSYVRFDRTNFVAEADQTIAKITNLNERLQAIYRQIGPDSFRDPDGKLMTQESALAKIKSQERDKHAIVLAQRKANTFASELNELYEKQPGQLDQLERLATAQGLPVTLTEPLTRFSTPVGVKGAEGFGEAAFALSTNQLLSLEPVVGEDAVYILGFKQRFASENPPFETVRERVTADFRQADATRLAQEAGRRFATAVTNGLAQKKTFEAVCAEEKVTPIKLSPFSLSTRSVPELGGRVDLSLVRDHALTLSPGQASDVVLTRDGALVVELISRQEMDEAQLKAELPAFLERARQSQQRQALAEWSRKEMEQMHIALPTLDGSRKRNEP
jgi:hypothetical protein